MGKMEVNNDKYNFLDVRKFDKLNEKVNNIVDGNTPEESPEKVAEESIDFSPDTYQSFVVDPKELDEDLLHQLADIVDKKSYYSVNDFNNDNKGPNTPDRLLSSIAVAYVLKDGLPVAVATLLDPTIENYKGIIASDYYELKSGKSMEDKIQQEFFAIKPEFHDQGLAQELKRQLLTMAQSMFIINPMSDKETSTGLFKNGYKLIARFDTEWEEEPVELWTN